MVGSKKVVLLRVDMSNHSIKNKATKGHARNKYKWRLNKPLIKSELVGFSKCVDNTIRFIIAEFPI